MSLETYFRARTLNRRGEVVLVGATPSARFYKVAGYDVSWHERKQTWTCTCVHGSLWGKQDWRKPCAHIVAAKIRKRADDENGLQEEMPVLQGVVHPES